MSDRTDHRRESFPVSLHLRVQTREGILVQEPLRHTYEPNSWSDAVKQLDLARRQRIQHPHCVITLEPLEEADSQSEEHVILQGLGTRWIALPPGFVSDSQNNAISDDEESFLSGGLMGAFRDWYLARKHSTSFVDADGQRIVMRQEPARGFTIEVHGRMPFEPETLPPRDGSFALKLWIDEPSSLSVSRTLTKIGYLTLCVASPQLALSPLLKRARRLIEHGHATDFAPYCERFLPGAAPGFEVVFRVEAEEVEPGVAEARRVVAAVRLHHASYMIALAGSEVPAPPPSDDATYRASVTKPERRLRTLGWQFDRFETSSRE